MHTNLCCLFVFSLSLLPHSIEKLVQNLHVNSTQPSSSTTFGVIGDGATGISNQISKQLHHHLNLQQQPNKLGAAQIANNNLKQPPQTTFIDNATTNMSNTALNSTPKLSVAGPKTDL